MIRRTAATDSSSPAAGVQGNLKTRKLIEWSPHDATRFAVASSTDLRLYDIQIQKGKRTSFSLQSPSIDIRELKSVTLLGVNYDIQGAKCMSWCPDDLERSLIAAGLPTGKVQLTFFPASSASNSSLSNGSKKSSHIIKEFVPKHSRACNCLAWNPIYKNLLVAGLDKVRGDFSALVWDIHHTSSENSSHVEGIKVAEMTRSILQTSESSFFISPSEVAIETVGKPLYEIANSESTMAIAWVPSNPFCLVTGTGVKWLRIYDLRGDQNSPQSVVAHSKSVQGISFSPFHSDRFLTFSDDGMIKFWDMKAFVEPVFVLNTNSKGLTQVEWCPTRSGVIACTSKEEKTIKFWDINDSLTSIGN